MDRIIPAEPPSHLSPLVETGALLDRQLGLLAEALAERLALAQQEAEQQHAFFSGQELQRAVLVARASADLVRAKAVFRGEIQLRYHVVREEGKKALRFAYYDPAGLEEPGVAGPATSSAVIPGEHRAQRRAM